MKHVSSHPVWSQPTNIDFVRQAWTRGESAGYIGKCLGVSKNSIIGLAHRLGLEKRASPIQRLGEPKVKAKRMDGPSPFALRTVIAAPTHAPVVQTRASSRQCCWLLGEKPYLQCDAAVERGSYCAAHAAVAYISRHAA